MRITHQHGQTVDQLDSASDLIGLSFRSTGSLFPDGWLITRRYRDSAASVYASSHLYIFMNSKKGALRG